jgi:hypothetical protein
MKVMAGHALFALRLYALLPSDKPGAKGEIERYIRDEVALPWK